MNAASVLTPLPVLIPTIGAAVTLFAGRRARLQRAITLVALSMIVAVCAALVYLDRPRRHARPACRRLGPDGTRHGTAGHHARG